MATKIVFCPPLSKNIMDVARGMVPAGYEFLVLEREDPQFPQAMKDAEYLMGFARGGMDGAFYKAAPKLKLIQLVSAGYDRLDIEAARKAGVPVANNGGANSVAVAEHTIMLMLSVLKRIAWMHNNVVAGKWRVGDIGEQRVYELAGKTLGIVGLGTIGKKVVRRAKGFDVQILYYDIARLTEDQEDALGVRFALLPELLRASDVVSLHVPLNDVTRGMIEHARVRHDEGERHPRQYLPRSRGGRGRAPSGIDHGQDRRRRARRHDGGAARGESLALQARQRDHHAAHGGPDARELDQGVPQRFDNVQRVAAGRTPMWVIPELRS